MVKILKIIGRVLLVPLEWLLILVIIFLFAIRTPSFQTYLARQATAFLSVELKSKVAVGAVDIVFFNRIYLDKVVVLDLAKDTLLAVGSIEANFDELTLSGKKIKLKNVGLNDGQVNVSKSLKTKQFNFQFMVDYFESDQPSSPSTPFDLAVQKVSIKNFAIHYHDLTKRRTPKNFNENHMDITRLNLLLTEIKRNKQGLFLAINNLKLKESCGLNVKNLSGHLAVKSNSVVLSSVDIKLNQSQLKARQIGIRWNNAADFDQFEDKVLWRIDLQPSRILLRDVAYFVPEMDGMKDTIGIQGLATNTLSHLFLKGIKLDYASNTHIYADLELPNFNNLADYNFKEKIYSATLDMKEIANFTLPNPMGKLSLGEEIGHLGIVQLANVSVRGDRGDFTFGKTILKTSIGDVAILQAIKLSVLHEVQISATLKDSFSIALQHFNLGKLLSLDQIGSIDGNVGFSSINLEKKGVESLGLSASLKKIEVLGYAYTDVSVTAAKVTDDVFEGKMAISDKNLALDYAGRIGFGANPFYDFSLLLGKASLDKLGLSAVSSTELTGGFVVDLKGSDLANLDGNLSCQNIFYKELKDDVRIPNLTLSIRRSDLADVLKVESSLGNIDLKGKINTATVVADFVFELAKVFPSLGINLKHQKSSFPSVFTFDVTTKNLDDLFSVFVPGLIVEAGTRIHGDFNADKETLNLGLQSSEIQYDNMVFEGIELNQMLTSKGLLVNYNITKFIFDDSIRLNKLIFQSEGSKGLLVSSLIWDANDRNYSNVSWDTRVNDNNDLTFNLNPSFFSINTIKWDILHSSIIKLSNNSVDFENLDFQRNNQKIRVDGKFSKNKDDKLLVNLQQIDLADISQLIGLDDELVGNFNSNATISNSSNGYQFVAKAEINEFKVNNAAIGNLKFSSDYDAESQSIKLEGDLAYEGLPAMDFDGAYFLTRERENFEMQLNFNNTDLSFVNGFIDPEVAKGISGKLVGKLSVKGSATEPELSGELQLVDAGAKIELLGVRYTLNGKVKISKDAIELNKIPIKDEDGNIASLIGQVYHTNFGNWIYDFYTNFDGNKSANSVSFNVDKKPTNRFLVLNTAYKEGDVYYGKAYGKGYAHISGYGSKMDVDVFVETKSGSQINFPMFGVSDIDEEDQLVHFISKNKDDVVEVREKVDYTGLNLKMKFRLTPEAKLRIIFNEQLGDEINAFGSGDIGLKLDAFNNINMEGTCTIQKGSKYNFAMGPVKQPFDIKQGSKITWTGDVENAIIDLITAVNIKKVSLLDLRPDLGDKTLENQEVNCLLKLRGSLVEPAISFEIQAPNATETGRALVAEVNADTDELNRQFFSLLLVKKFQTSKGAVSASSTAALDLVESQINGLLGQLSKDYKVNVDLGETNALASVQKNFLNDRLLITGSFGVENSSAEGQTTSGFIGDVSVEYLVNKKGTLRVNAFNKSNTNTVDESSGPFTQGAGLSYHEEFNTLKDFELYQYTMDVFRPKDKKYFKNKRKKRQTRIPSLILDNGNTPALKKD